MEKKQIAKLLFTDLVEGFLILTYISYALKSVFCVNVHSLRRYIYYCETYLNVLFDVS